MQGTSARGGELITEVACVDDECQFPDYAGVVSYKVGAQLYRDAPVAQNGGELLPLAEDTQEAACALSGSFGDECRTRFDRNRRDIFHYALYAHARGVPKAHCLLPDGTEDQACRLNNHDFHIPKSSSGAGDLWGGDILVTLGLWSATNFIGTDFAVASTTFHEIGHNLGLWHGGAAATFTQVNVPGTGARANVAIEPNCKPNYLSVMSYMFQLRGLVDVFGVPQCGLLVAKASRRSRRNR